MKTIWMQFPEKHWIFIGFAQTLDSVQRLSQLLQNNKNLTGRSKTVDLIQK